MSDAKQSAAIKKPVEKKIEPKIVKFEIYRYDPDQDEKPYMKAYEVISLNIIA